MKRNVDLTQNRDFGQVFDLNSLRSMISKSLSKNPFPWNFENLLYFTVGKTEEILFTGNKEERKYKKDNKNYEEGLECECCGADLSKKRWNERYGLCPKCDINLSQENTKKPWLKFNN